MQATGVMVEQKKQDQAQPAARRGGHSPRRVTAGELFAGATELLIQHAGREYRLRITQNGKLILTA